MSTSTSAERLAPRIARREEEHDAGPAPAVTTEGLAADGGTVEQRIRRLARSLTWHRRLEDVLHEARTQGKLAFFQHMLGELEGDACSAAHSLRATTLSHPRVLAELGRSFACGWQDIGTLPWCGNSGVHPRGVDALHTTNGAGPHNTQGFVLAPDGTVLHCLLGYWHHDDFLHELELAEALHRVWIDPGLGREQKDERFRALHEAHVGRHSPELVARSALQSFDVDHERARAWAREIQGGVERVEMRDDKGREYLALRLRNALGSQLLFTTPDGRVVHALLGRWHEVDLAHEIVFARKMNKIWSLDLPLAEKQERFARRHGEQAADWPARHADTQRLSELTHAWMARHPFVPLAELDLASLTEDGRLAFDARPRFAPGEIVDEPLARLSADGTFCLQRADVVLHQRMARRPFLRYEDFDTPVYSDYGRLMYDLRQDKFGRPAEERHLPAPRTPRARFFDVHTT